MRRRVLVVIIAVIAGVGACGGERSAREILIDAPGKTLAEQTSSIDIVVEVAGGRRSGSFRGQGVFDYRAQQGRLSFDLAQFGLPGSRGRAEMLLFRELVYLKLPIDVPELAARPWVKIDVNRLGEQSGLGNLGQLQNSDPSAYIRLLRSVSGEVEDEGSEKVRGVETTHYRTVLDLDEAKRQLPPEIGRIIDQLGTRQLPTDAWVDEDGRLRRLRHSVDLAKVKAPPAAGEALEGTVTTTYELHDFGVKVDVAPPPPDQVSDLASLLAGARPR
ncbi:MAG: hypothetical protein M3N68_02560 [Actinomycetota bacterium]|nr:hypothetical protein [Actinomycetota bacterium]